MSACVRTCAIVGVEAVPVSVESDIAFGLPAFNVVGLPDTAVKEARERIRAAIRQAGLGFPQTRITVNLAPADVRKQGPAFDVPIALALLIAQGDIPTPDARAVFLGELGLDGSARPVRGVLAAALFAAKSGAARIFVPAANATEAVSVPNIEVLGFASLSELVSHLRGETSLTPQARDSAGTGIDAAAEDLSHIRGQAHAKRGMEIAAAGGHHVLLFGPPGTGKTMLARALPGILPALSRDEAVEASVIASVAGALPAGSGLLRARPFRTPHHSSSAAALVGGGTIPRPGEVSLAHRGVLFLDELPEFHPHVLEQLRQPLEDGVAAIARVGGSVRFPARFLLVAAMNPCPCGHAGNPKRLCGCGPKRSAAYRQRVSGPLFDRFDLTLRVSPPDPDRLLDRAGGEHSSVVRERVEQARDRQLRRFAGTALACNADIPAGRLEEWCALDPASKQLLKRSLDAGWLSARGFARVRKVARTIADLEGTSAITESHVAEALNYRLPSLDDQRT